MGLISFIVEIAQVIVICAWLTLMIFGVSVAWNFGKEFTKIIIARWRVSEMDKMMKEHPEMFEEAPKKNQRRR